MPYNIFLNIVHKKSVLIQQNKYFCFLKLKKTLYTLYIKIVFKIKLLTSYTNLHYDNLLKHNNRKYFSIRPYILHPSIYIKIFSYRKKIKKLN